MKSKKKSLLTLSILLISAAVIAQDINSENKADSTSVNNYTLAATPVKKKDTLWHAKNYFKINLAALLVKNYSFQYERILSRKISVAIGFRTMPNTSLPFKNTLKKAIGDNDQETLDQIENLRMDNIAITPEVRIYLSKKGYGRGFYVAPFYRYGKYNVKGVDIKYKDELQVEKTLTMSGKLTGNSFGLLLGVQKQLGKHFSLDWWLLGPHYGTGKGDLTGAAEQPLTIAEQDDLRQTLDDIDISPIKTEVTVNANGANIKFDGPFAGLRTGIVLAFKF